MTTAPIALNLQNRSLTRLLGGQGVVVLVNLLYGKATALSISPTQWGQYSMAFAAMTLAHGFLVSPTIQSFKASLAEFSHRVVINFYGRVLLLIYAGVFSLLAIGAGIYYQNSVWALVWMAAVGQGVYAISTEYLNVSSRHRTYALLLVLYALSNLILFDVIVVGFEQRNATGLWLVVAVLNVAFAGISVWLANGFQFESQRFDNWFPANLWRFYQRYSWPLLSLAGWSWLISYADRYLIRFYLTDADVGQYAMGYSLGAKLLILVAPLIAFISPSVFGLKADNQPISTVNWLILHYLKRYAVVAGGVCLLFFGLYKWIGALLLAPVYEPAFVLGPIIATGYLFLTFIHLLEVKWYAYGQTRFVLIHNILGAILNIILNLVLIPHFGIVGAALATLLGFVGQFIIVCWLFFRRG